MQRTSPYAKRVPAILAEMEQQREEDERAKHQPAQDEEGPERVVYVYRTEDGGLFVTPTKVDDEEEAAPMIDRQESSASPPTRREPSFLLHVVLLLLLFVFLDNADTTVTALLAPTATITLTPQVQTLTAQSTAQLGKWLSPITLSESQTVPATGHGHQNAARSTGTLTFYNGELQSVTIPAGKVFIGRDGEHIEITQDAIIPAADPLTNPPTFGQVTVSAQATHLGESGNIPAFDISSSCCAASVIVKNLAPFAYGRNAREYLMVTKADRDSAAATLKAKVTVSMAAALQGQLMQGERLQSMPCTLTDTADHGVGDEASQVTVSASETCSAVAYNVQQLNARATQLLTTQANKKIGTGYMLYGNVKVHIMHAITLHASPVVLFFTCQGTYVYQLRATTQQSILTQIAGKPRLSALHQLGTLPGIQHATISGISDNQPLPNDTTHIHILLLVTIY